MTDSGDGARTDAPSEAADTPADGPNGVVGWLKWFWTTEKPSVIYIRDVVTSVAAVLLIGLVLFGISGIWPPMVAVESGSMEPNMVRGDLVFVVDNDRYVPEEAPMYQGESTGVIPADTAAETGHEEFGRNGDVVVYMPNGNDRRTPVIHRAMLWVTDGENWYDRADKSAVGGADNCDELNHCPAPHAGFITLGDANPQYDQQSTLSAPVRPSWVIGTAEMKVPYLGHVRLAFSGQVAPPVDPVTAENSSASMSAPSPAMPPAGTPRPVA
ncbi:MAG: signal peptidase [Natronomonas sp.]|jgi:signal peptidase|uniref:S26 family signal peptidase n=1 Tax=Natronomonas sp. TaxID=2184060 RepID=UPI003988ACA2